MRIEKLTFENFKCFKKVDLELGKITLLTGANSSGKSSVIFGILGALQSGDFPLHFSPNGKYVEMGGFSDISYRHNNNFIQLSFTISNSETIEVYSSWAINEKSKLPELRNLKAMSNYYTLEINKDNNFHLKFSYTFGKDHDTGQESYNMLIRLIEVFNEKSFDSVTKEKYQKEIDSYKNREFLNHIEFSFNDFADLPQKILKNGGLLYYLTFNEFLDIFKNIDKKINYVSSFRLHPDRTYYEQTKTEFKVGKFGEKYTDQIIQWQTKDEKKYKELITSLKKINLLEEIKAKRFDGGRYELLVKPTKKSVTSSLADVGFGISQFLPIIVADMQLNDNSLLFVSQPEIHLHPSVQANFADYLVNQIKTTNKTYIIETHSEYIINRLRLAIVKGETSDADIKSYFFKNNGVDVESYKLGFTKSGQILNAPEDFFKTYMMDVMDIAINAVE